ncbi:MAG TPA: DoxX family protein [Terriglobales bacterium]|jgi:putative oxidoreductase
MSKSWGLTILRIVVGIVFLVHGGQKLFQLGLHGVTGFFQMIHIPLPAVAAAVVTFVEFLGGVALILGLATRWAAILIALDMAGAIFFVHGSKGFFLQSGGFEYAMTLLAANVALALAGPGAAALDNLIGKRK